MRKFSIALTVALLLSSCGGTTLEDHNKIANGYRGSWTSDTVPVGGSVVIEFDQNGDISGGFNDPNGALAFSVVPAESTFNGNHVNLTVGNAVGGGKFILIGDLFLNGTSLTGTLLRRDDHSHYTINVGVPPP